MHMQLPQLLAQLGEFKPPVDNNWTNNLATTDATLTTLELVISSVLGILTTIGGVLFIYAFLLGSINWITAGGDTGKVQKARDQMIQGMIGLIILVAAYAIIGLVGTIVGMDILTPADVISNILP
ncbi:hypothetical protein KA012_00075 [Candidatus Woesebacteria bacterium]|nr:hypothetical protein [Candidatus Woesebacteria bacterium]